MARGLRTMLAIVLMVAGCLALPLAVTAQWADATVTERDGFVDTLAPLSDDEAVQAMAEQQITDQVMAVVDKAPLPGILTDGVESRVEDVAEKLVASKRFDEAWRTALDDLHPDLVAALTGRDQDALVVGEDGKVRLVLDTIADDVRDAVADAGIPGTSLLPDVDVTIPIGTEQQVETAGTAYDALDGRGTLLGWLTVVLLVAAVAVAPGLWGRAVVAVLAAVGGIGMLVLTGAAVDRGEVAAVDRMPTEARETGEAAVALTTESLHERLADLTQVFGSAAVIAVALLAVLWFAGKRRAIDSEAWDS